MVVWPFIPQREFTESLEWLTEVLRSKGAEQRISLRPQARQEHFFEYLVDDQQLARAKYLARFAGAEELAVPSWEFMSRVGAVALGTTSVAVDTTEAPYRVGDMAIVWQEDDFFEVRQIEEMTGSSISWPSLPLERGYGLAYVMPVRTSQFLQDPEVSRGTNPLKRMQARFVTTQFYSLGDDFDAGYPTYRGYDVMDDRTVLLSDVSERFAREASVIDPGLGSIWRAPEFTYPVQTSSVAWSLDNHSDLWRLRGWLDARRGRWRGFWMPSWNADFVLAANAVSSDVTLTVRNVGHHLYDGVRDIMILTASGDKHFLRVNSATAGFSGNEVLQLAAPLGFNLSTANAQLICLMSYMRLDADRVEIKYRAGRGADVAVNIMEAPEP